MCRNLKYSLEQMKIAGEKDNYMKIIDSVIVGPEIVRNVQILLLLVKQWQDPGNLPNYLVYFNLSFLVSLIICSMYAWFILTLFHNYKTLSIRNIDIEDILGVNPDILNISFKKRKDQVDGGLRPSWQPDEYIYQRRPESRSPSPALARRTRRSWKCPDIHYQFESFSRFGDSSMLNHPN